MRYGETKRRPAGLFTKRTLYVKDLRLEERVGKKNRKERKDELVVDCSEARPCLDHYIDNVL